jgi:SH3 domain
MYVALYDYDARADDDLSLKKQDHLEIIDKPEVGKFQTTQSENLFNFICNLFRVNGGTPVTCRAKRGGYLANMLQSWLRKKLSRK